MSTIADLILPPAAVLSSNEAGFGHDAAAFAATGPNQTSRSLDTINDMLETVRSHLGMDVAFISRQIGTTHRVFTHVTSDGTAPLCAGDTNDNDNSLCWLVIEGRLPEKIHDTGEYELARALPVVEQLDVRSHFSVPMHRRDGSVHGSLCCFSHRPRPEITDRDMRVLRSAAAIVSDQIEHRIEREERAALALRKMDAVFSDGALTIYHQPIVEISTRRLAGYECLLRGTGDLDESPTHLFASAYEAGKGFELEMHAASQALATIARAGSDKFITINVSPATLTSDAFWSMIPEGISDRLLVEITESAAISDFDTVVNAIERTKQKAWIAIDDVGAGFAGLQHLVQLGPDVLKIDRDLIAGIAKDPVRRALASALEQFTRETGSTLIAEGVETQADLEAVRQLDIRFAQGFLLGRPAFPGTEKRVC